MPPAKPDKDADNLAAVLEKIPKMFKDQTDIGMRLHDLILETNPKLKPRLWYGMPGYALGRSKPVIVFIRKDKYVTFGLDEKANVNIEELKLDQLMPSAWFLTELDAATEARIADIVRAATG